MTDPHWTTIGAFWATIAVMIVTLIATLINYYIFRTQTDPEVIVYTKHDLNRPTIITLVVENIGKSTAYDVQFKFSDKIPGKAFGWEDIPEDKIQWLEEGPFKNGIPSLQPGGKREMDWGQYVGLRSVIGDKPVFVTTLYKGKKLFHPRQSIYKTESVIDVNSYLGTVANDQNEARKNRKEIEKISQAINNIGDGSKTLYVKIKEEQKGN